ETNYPTKFCHHFYFLPEPFKENKNLGEEISRFRGEEGHELADKNFFRIETFKRGKGRIVSIFIPKECLYGYDPTVFNRIGFTYQINAPGGVCQTFSCDSGEVKLPQQPSLWASLELI
ncbi:MAG: hypothetical protein KDK55_04735, partial [Chlamydiia bacterium]|nr:hypothetical protein [Chlamydiia bacterium]